MWIGFLLVVGCGDISVRDFGQFSDEECLDSPEFVCVTVSVPVDHFDPSVPGNLDIRFAIHPASSGRPEGVLVTAVGGPGGSGLEVAEGLTMALDSSIIERFDLVYFDPRGVALDEEFTCPETLEEDQNSDLVVSEADWPSVRAELGEYMSSCVLEMARPDLLPYLGTRQAVEDLEIFRELVGYDRVTIYGQSYGTRYAQMYAQAHPDSVERLILDGTVDIALDDLEATADDVATQHGIVKRALDECAKDPTCLDDMGMSPHEAYDDLMQRLRLEPESVSFPAEPDVWEEEELTAEDVVFIGRDAAYSTELKMLFVRAIAASTRGDLVSMFRLIANDPVGGSDSALNIVVNCHDRFVPGETFDTENAAIEGLFNSLPPEQRWRTMSIGVCPHVPGVDPSDGRLARFVGDGIPTLVVGSVDDPATPYSESLSMFEHLSHGHLLTVRGGDHVMFGRGEPCIDELVTGFIRGETTPRASTCVVEQLQYEPLLADWQPRPALAERIDDELWLAPELYGWDGFEEYVVACPYGGKATFTGSDGEAWYDLEGCGLAPDVLVSGDGLWDFEEGRSSNELTFADSTCSYVYDHLWGDWADSYESC